MGRLQCIDWGGGGDNARSSKPNDQHSQAAHLLHFKLLCWRDVAGKVAAVVGAGSLRVEEGRQCGV
jgi:hypothetical protein